MAVHEVPASKASQKQNRFEFKVPGERKTWSLPLLKFLPIGYRTRLEKLSAPIVRAKEAGQDPAREDLRAYGEWQLEILDRYAPGLTDLLDDEQLAWLLKSWGEASGVTLGESSGSATS